MAVSTTRGHNKLYIRTGMDQMISIVETVECDFCLIEEYLALVAKSQVLPSLL